jgi:hypothetical protein
MLQSQVLTDLRTVTVTGRQYLLMYSMLALKYTRIVQVPHGLFQQTARCTERFTAEIRSLLWKLAAGVILGS